MACTIRSASSSPSAEWSVTPNTGRIQVVSDEQLVGDDLASIGFDQWLTTEKNRILLTNDDHLVTHRRHVGTGRCARIEHRSHLRNALEALIGAWLYKIPAEVCIVREHLVLAWQNSAAGVHQIAARQPTLQRDFLCTQVLIDHHRIIRCRP